MKMTIDQHAVYVSTLVPHDEDMLICLEIAAPHQGGTVILTFSQLDALGLIRALDGAIDQVLEYAIKRREDR